LEGSPQGQVDDNLQIRILGNIPGKKSLAVMLKPTAQRYSYHRITLIELERQNLSLKEPEVIFIE
jgi:hypothetical protein